MLENRRAPVAALARGLIGLGFLSLIACGDRAGPADIGGLAAGEELLSRIQAQHGPELAELRLLTAPFHNFAKAVEAGWAAQITPCWHHVTQGAMGYHYGNPDLIFDGGHVDLLEPEALMYEPGPAGQLRLVGLEYIVFIDDWTEASPPVLLGQPFEQHSFLPIYKLHIWLWRNNPNGLFADWNPKVSCEHAEETELFG